MLYNLQYRDLTTLTTTTVTVTGIDESFYDPPGFINPSTLYESRRQYYDDTTTYDYSEWVEFTTQPAKFAGAVTGIIVIESAINGIIGMSTAISGSVAESPVITATIKR